MRIIDADKLKAHFAWWKGGSREMTMDEAKSDFDCIIDLQPTIDAEPRKHGHWIEEGLVDGNQNRYCRCSECGKGDTQAVSQRVPYCWWCGAKMDEVEE